MCAKKVRNEIDALRGDLQQLSEAVWALRDHVTVQSAAAAANGRTSKSHPRLAEDLAERASDDGVQGIVTTRGYFLDGTGSREYRWDLERRAVDLLTIDQGEVARMLAAIGHRQRFLILKAILDRPMSAAELVAALDLGTTGAAYHHLNVLQAADLVTPEGRGTFAVVPHRVSAIFAILAGVDSAIDTTYTTREPDGQDAPQPDAVVEPERAPAKARRKKAPRAS